MNSKEAERLLMPILSENFIGTDCKSKSECNKIARDHIISFYHKLKEMKPNNELECHMGIYEDYLHRLIKTRKTLQSGDYQEACYKLQDVLHYTYILQKNVYCNVIDLIQKFVL